MKVAAIQTDIAWEDPSANFERLDPRLAEAREAGARLLILPETFACGFSMNADRVAEPPAGPTTRFLRGRARDLDAWIGGSVPLRQAGTAKPHNTFLLAGPGGELLRYRKMHPFTFHGEHEVYAAGDAPTVWDVEGLKLAPFVCYDLRFADEFWGLAEAVDGYLVVANWPARRRRHWRVLLRARAIENQAYVVGVNRVGPGGDAGEIDHAGDSVVLDPSGDVLAEAGEAPETLLADLDPAHVREVRSTFPVLRDRRKPATDG